MMLILCRVNKQECDYIQKDLVDRQKEEKKMLGQIYQNQINQSRKQKQNEKQMERELERMQVERAQSIDPEAYNKLKKKAYQQELRKELEQKNKQKNRRSKLVTSVTNGNRIRK